MQIVARSDTTCCRCRQLAAGHRGQQEHCQQSGGARPPNDLRNNSVEQDHVKITVVSDNEDIHDHGHHTCDASRTTPMNKDTSLTAPSGQPQVHVQLATTTATLNNTSPIAHLWPAAERYNGGGNVHEDHTVNSRSLRKHHATQCIMAGDIKPTHVIKTTAVSGSDLDTASPPDNSHTSCRTRDIFATAAIGNEPRRPTVDIFGGSGTSAAAVNATATDIRPTDDGMNNDTVVKGTHKCADQVATNTVTGTTSKNTSSAARSEGLQTISKQQNT